MQRNGIDVRSVTAAVTAGPSTPARVARRGPVKSCQCLGVAVKVPRQRPSTVTMPVQVRSGRLGPQAPAPGPGPCVWSHVLTRSDARAGDAKSSLAADRIMMATAFNLLQAAKATADSTVGCLVGREPSIKPQPRRIVKPVSGTVV